MKHDLNCFDRNSVELCIFCRLYFNFVLSPVFKYKALAGILSSSIWVLYQGRIFLAPKKTLPTCFVLSARNSKFLFFYVFFHSVCQPFNEPKTSGNWTHKYHKMALLFITSFLYWTFFYLLYLLSLIRIFFCYLFVLTYFDSLRWHIHVTTRLTGTQIVCAKMTSLDAIFCGGNKSSSRSLACFCRRKHKKSTARTSHSWKNLSLTCRQVYLWLKAEISAEINQRIFRSL